MERKLMDKLQKWKEDTNRKPLLLQGARQVGKTWLVKEFGKRFFADTIYINFDRERFLEPLLQETLDSKKIISAIALQFGKKISCDDTLIIFDEIQEIPRVLSALKYFYEDAPEYFIIGTGSFMGISLHQGTSFPVGKVWLEYLYPLTFDEFLTAGGNVGLSEIINNKDIQMMTAFKTQFIEQLKYYYVIGGMPEAVDSFIRENDFYKVRDIQQSIIDLYRQDFSKHAAPTVVPRLNQVWDSIPSQLSKENRKYIYGQVSKGSRAKDFEIAIQWLKDCGLIHTVHRISAPKMPLKTYMELNAFKIFLNDVGLLGAMGELSPKAILEGNRLFVEFKGALTEQFVLQQIISEQGITPFYYSTDNSRGEIDFIVQHDDTIIPIEVKAEENLQAKSLKAFCSKYDMHGARISMSDYRRQDWMTNYPLYAFVKMLF